LLKLGWTYAGRVGSGGPGQQETAKREPVAAMARTAAFAYFMMSMEWFGFGSLTKDARGWADSNGIDYRCKGKSDRDRTSSVTVVPVILLNSRT
jgi:hypothetical protein